MKNRIPKKMWAIWLVCIPLGIIAGLLVTKVLKTPPQNEMARKFLADHSEMFNHLGGVKSVVYAPDASTHVLFSAHKNEGVYSFDVAGEKGHERVRVYWESTNVGDNFKVLRVEMIQGSGKPIVLWLNDGERASEKNPRI